MAFCAEQLQPVLLERVTSAAMEVLCHELKKANNAIKDCVKAMYGQTRPVGLYFFE